MEVSEEEILRAFALHLKELRKKYGFSQEKLAATADLDLSHIAKMETSKRNPRLTTLITLGLAMGIPFGEVINFTIPSQSPKKGNNKSNKEE